MALLIYKQWHRSTREKDTPMSNAMHVKYIGERVHVLKDENTENGLFGKFGGEVFEQANMAKAMQYVHHQSCLNKNIYRSTISFTPERAEMLELGGDKKRWENFVKYHIADIAKGNGIDLGKFEYLAAVHLKEGQPHVHIMFWDVSQKIAVNYVNPQACASIRENIELSVFEELAAVKLYDDTEENDKDFTLNSKRYIEDNGNSSRTAMIKSAFEEERKAYHDIQNKSFKDAAELSRAQIQRIATQLSGDSYIEEGFVTLSATLPKSGSIEYKYLQPDMKKAVDDFVDKLAESCPVIKASIESYIEAKSLEAQMYDSTVTQAGRSHTAMIAGKARYDVRVKISNVITQAVKRFNIEKRLLEKEERSAKYQADTAEREKEMRKFQTETAVISVLRLLKDFSRSSGAEMSAASAKVFGRGDLSAAAIKDLLYRMQDKEELSR